jgi:Rps23 Pro-64 3,4-dihydroxylase Tpa1-like proline 4-hydroxylase
MTTGTDPIVRLNPRLDPRHIAPVFKAHGRVHITRVFPDDVAERIRRAMVEETPWGRVLGGEGRHHDFGPDGWETIPADKRAELERAVQQMGCTGFAYFYDNFPVADFKAAGQHADSYLMRVFEFLNSEAFLSFARIVVGAPGIALADAQATCYRPGDFLTQHDDHAPEKKRRAAYILNFTRPWRADWGGLLQFLDGDGHVAEAYTPVFNALNLVRVPQPHSVSYVTPLAAGARYSMTGWLREA